MVQLTTKAFAVIIGAIGLYAGFVIFSDLSLLAQKFQNYDFVYLPFAFLLVLISYFIRGLRWNMLLKNLKIDISLSRSLLIFFAGLGLGITPGKFGEVIKSHFLKKDHEQSISKTASIVFVERYYDLVGIVIISVFGVLFIDVGRIPIIIAFLMLIVVVLISRQRKLVIPLLERFGRFKLLKKFSSFMLDTYQTTFTLLASRVYLKSTLFSISAWIIESTAVYLVFRGFGIDLSFPIILLIFTASSIAGAISMLPGGIGITEGGMVGLLLLQGIDYTTSFSAVLLVRIVTLWFSVIIGLIALRMVTKKKDKN